METANNKIVGYARVSSKKQGNGLSLEGQKNSIYEYAKSNGLEVVAFYSDLSSGSDKNTKNREGIHSAIKTAKENNAKLCIAKIDRLTRSVRFVCDLRDSKVAFFAIDMPDANEFTINLLASLAEAEHKAISARVKQSYKNRRAKGITDFGNEKFYTNEGRAKGTEVVKSKKDIYIKQYGELFSMYKKQGLTYREVANKLNQIGIKSTRGGEISHVFAMNVIKAYESMQS